MSWSQVSKGIIPKYKSFLLGSRPAAQDARRSSEAAAQAQLQASLPARSPAHWRACISQLRHLPLHRTPALKDFVSVALLSLLPAPARIRTLLHFVSSSTSYKIILY